MAEPDVLFKVVEGVALLTLNRPQKRNALKREMLAELRSRLRDVRSGSEIRVLVLSATGPAFCAGMDLQQMQETAALPNAPDLWREDAEVYREVVRELVSLPLPTLAVVQGAAMAGGAGLVLACDLVLASEAAKIGLPEPRRGITASIVAPLLAYRVGAGRAGYLLLSGKILDAAQARTLGAFHDVVAAEDLSEARDTLVNSVLTGSPAALAATKQQLLDGAGANALFAELDWAVSLSAHARETEDAREGLRAFLEQREPAWHPRAAWRGDGS